MTTIFQFSYDSCRGFGNSVRVLGMRSAMAIKIRLALSLPLAAFFLACHTAPLITDFQSDCASDHPKVGQIAVLNGRFHSVSGTARIIDNCTIRIENFTYDGGGLDVRVFSARNMDYINGKPLTNDLKKSGGYMGETLEVKLPMNVSLDEINNISIWCVSVAENFGDGTFR